MPLSGRFEDRERAGVGRLVALCVLAAAAWSAPAAALEPESWYVVGPLGLDRESDDPLSGSPADVAWLRSAELFAGGQQAVESDPTQAQPSRVDVGLTFDGQGPTLGIGREQNRLGSVPSDVYTFLLNRSVEWDLGSGLRPHMVAGVGVAYIDIEGVERPAQADSSLVPAFRLGFGASYALSDTWDVTAHYRAFYAGALHRDPSGDPEGGLAYDFMIGTRLRF